MKRLCILLFLFSFHTSFVYAETKQIQLKVDRQEVEINHQKIAYQGTPFFDNGKGVIYCHVRSIPEMIQQDLELIWESKIKLYKKIIKSIFPFFYCRKPLMLTYK